MRAGVISVLTALALVVAGSCGASSALAGQSNANAKATWSYLRADYRYERAVKERLPASRRALGMLERAVDRGCAGALKGAPEGAQLQTLRAEIVFAPFTVVGKPDARQTRALLGTLRNLRWSDRTLTKRVHRAAASEESIPAPHLCAAVRAWVKSDYRTLSPATVAFVRSMRSKVVVEGPGEQGIEEMLEPYEMPRAARLARRLNTLKESVSASLLRLLGGGFKKLERDLEVPREPGA